MCRPQQGWPAHPISPVHPHTRGVAAAQTRRWQRYLHCCLLLALGLSVTFWVQLPSQEETINDLGELGLPHFAIPWLDSASEEGYIRAAPLPVTAPSPLPAPTPVLPMEIPPPLQEGGLLRSLARGKTVEVRGLVPQALLAQGAERVSQAAAPVRMATASRPLKPFNTYFVQSGDSLATIATRAGVSIQSLLWNNPDVKDSPNLLQIGQEIVTPMADGIVYSVRLGDTVSRISEIYDVEIEAILADNGLADPDALVKGQTLFLRGAEPPPLPRPAPAPAPARAPAPAPAAVAAAAPPPAPGASASSSRFIWPVSGSITEYFGAPRGQGVYHTGLDIATRVSVPIAASAAGQVTYVAKIGYGYGWHVIIGHADGYETLYSHLSRIDVSVGDKISQGQVIGLTGCTGYCTGTHLHFEVRRNGGYLNPLDFLP